MSIGGGLILFLSIFQTQPVPNPIAYFMHRSPWWFHRFETLVNHFIELVVPFFLFLGRRMCIVHGLLQILFQVRCSWVGFQRVTSSPRMEQRVLEACNMSPAFRASCLTVGQAGTWVTEVHTLSSHEDVGTCGVSGAASRGTDSIGRSRVQAQVNQDDSQL